ncbi:MAG: Xaa-Pro peptidase family protein [Conexivisphaerales archaeon]
MLSAKTIDLITVGIDSPYPLQLEKVVAVRKRKALDFMKGRGLGAMVLSRLDNARFVSGLRPVISPWLINSYWAVLGIEGDLHLLVPSGDSRRMERTMPWIDEVVQFHSSRKLEIVSETLREAGDRSGAIGYDSFEYDELRKLKRLMPRAKFVTVGNELLEVRARKLPEEIQVIRSGAKVTEQAVSFAVEMAKDGLKECELAGMAENEARRLGAEGVSWSFATFSGDHAGLMYRHDSEKRLKEGEFLILGYATIYNGYNTDITATTIVGERPNGEQKRLFSAVYESYREALAMVKPGLTTQSISERAAAVLREAGIPDSNSFVSFQPLIHGIGMNVYEPPFSPDPGARTPSTKLEPGHVLAVEPAVASFDKPSKGGVRIGETLHLVDGGYEILGRMPEKVISIFSSR